MVDIKPPLTIIYVGNGCEAYSNNLCIPAKSELTSRDDTVVCHNYFQQFNTKYQNLTKYSLIEDLGIEKLTNKEIENLPDCLAALPNLRFNELKRRLVEIKKPLHIHYLMTNRLRALETRLTSLLNSITTPGTELALPSTSHGLDLPCRRDSLPMVELNVAQQMVQETVKDMDMESSKVRRYKKYLQNHAMDVEKKTNK